MRPAARLLLVLTWACDGASGPTSVDARLPPGTVAVVGQDPISVDTVRRIARAQGVGHRAACDLAVRDAVLAAAARAELAGSAIPSSTERSVLARAQLERVKAEAAVAPVTDAEVAEVTMRHWTEIDRPPAARTAHAVVLVKRPADDAPARALATRIAAAVSGITDPVAFVGRAREVAPGSLSVSAERLPAVTFDGRVVDLEAPPGAPVRRFDSDFARAANALGTTGEQSGVIRTSFGYHVILLEERLPERRVSLAERRQSLQGEIYDDRARRALEAIVDGARSRTPIEISRAAADLTGRVSP